MKYTIEGFNQEFALNLTKKVEEKGELVEKRIDVLDLVILRWFTDFYPKMSKINVNDREYAIVQFSYLEQELPLLYISKRAFSDRMRKLATLEVLDYEFYNNNLPTYTFGINYLPLISSSSQDVGGMQKIARGCSPDYEGVVVQTTTYPNTIYPNKEKSIINNTLKESGKKTFVRPTLEEVLEYCKERNKGVDGEQWYDFYTSKGWLIGKTPMKDWKAAIRTWERSKNNKQETKKQAPTLPEFVY